MHKKHGEGASVCATRSSFELFLSSHMMQCSELLHMSIVAVSDTSE
jgi:hypothetical protein